MDILSIPSLDERKEVCDLLIIRYWCSDSNQQNFNESKNFLPIIQEIMIEVRVTHIWKDSRLLTSKLPTSVELEPSSLTDLWVPDSYFHHTKELKFVRLMTTAASMVIHPNQTIKYSEM